MSSLINLILTVLFAFFLPLISAESGCKGCVSLDDVNFDKVIPKFEVVLVKFDVAYPYGDKHNAFMNFAKEVTNSPDLLLAEVGVKDYGEKANEELAARFNLKKDDFPALRLFINGKPKDKPLEFSKDDTWSTDKIRDFVRDNTKIYIGLPGCLEEFDKLASDFVTSPNKKTILEKAEKALEKLSEENKNAGNTYIKFMKKIEEAGNSFIKTETARLNKIISEGKLKEKKKEELTLRLNILRSFSLPLKDEL